jgi:hypothetical protein
MWRSGNAIVEHCGQGFAATWAGGREIQETAAVSALRRNWSTVYNGMRIDLERFKKEVGGM